MVWGCPLLCAILRGGGGLNIVIISLSPLFLSPPPPTLLVQGLADESEFVRETSLQAGQTIVNRYADTAVELFLPELEHGLFDENWRIRWVGLPCACDMHVIRM